MGMTFMANFVVIKANKNAAPLLQIPNIDSARKARDQKSLEYLNVAEVFHGLKNY